MKCYQYKIDLRAADSTDNCSLVLLDSADALRNYYQVALKEQLETFNIRCPCGDLTFFVHAKKHGGFETVVLGEDASKSGAGFLGAVFVIGSDENDVLTFAWSGFSFVGYLSGKWSDGE